MPKQTELELDVLGKLNVAANYAAMALRWNNDRSRREDNDPALDNLQQEQARLALKWIEDARQTIIFRTPDHAAARAEQALAEAKDG